MKTLRQVCAATILSLALAASALAGHIDTTGAAAPAPPTGGATQTIVLTIISLIYR